MNKKLLILGASVVLSACGGSGSSTSINDTCTDIASQTFNCTDMLNNIVDYAVKPVVSKFKADIAALDQKTDAYCASLEQEGETGALTEAKGAWEDAMDSVQQLAVMQFGPLKSGFKELYAWPEIGSCLTDLQIAEGALADTASRGMSAMEYVLFADKATVSCELEDPASDFYSTAVVNWVEGKTDAQKQADRCSYAQQVMEDMTTRSSNLETDWNTYNITLNEPNLQNVAGSISDALFYIDKQTKDAKLKAVLPNTDVNRENFDAGALESQYAHYSAENIKNNIVGAQLVLTANGQGLGLDDYLTAAGQGELGQNMNNALTATTDNVATIGESFYDVLTSQSLTAADAEICSSTSDYLVQQTDIARLCALHATMKSFTDLLKNDFIFTTSFTTPSGAASEND